MGKLNTPKTNEFGDLKSCEFSDSLQSESDKSTINRKSLNYIIWKVDKVVVEVVISKTLRQLMTERRYSLTQLAKEANVATSTLNEWLSGRTPKDPIKVKRVASVLSVSLHYLLFGQEEEAAVFRANATDQKIGEFEIVIRRIGKVE